MEKAHKINNFGSNKIIAAWVATFFVFSGFCGSLIYTKNAIAQNAIAQNAAATSAVTPSEFTQNIKKTKTNKDVIKEEKNNDLKPTSWTPTQTIYSYAPAGVGGGIDNMGRIIQDIIIKYEFLNQFIVFQNKSAQSGSQAFLEMKEYKNDPHRLIFTLTNLFTNPYSQNLSFRWSDIEPITIMAFDQFILWVPSGTQTDVKTFVEEARKANGKMVIGGTGEKQEDQIVSEAVGKAIDAKFNYTSFASGGEIAKQLAAKKINWSVNNPAEAINEWREGLVVPLCVFDNQRMPYKQLITKTKSWNDIPTCKEQGIDVVYLMHRGVFAPLGLTEPQKQFYRNLMNQVSATPEWQAAAEENAWNLTKYTGAELKQYFTEADKLHYNLMKDAGFLYKDKKE